MRSGEEFAEAAARDADLLRSLDRQRLEVRARLVENLRSASAKGQTQQNLADKCGYARQRIAQFINGPAPKKSR